MVDDFLSMPNGGSKFDITIMAAWDIGIVVEGAEMAKGAGMTLASSSLVLTSLRGMIVTRRMPNLVTAIGALMMAPNTLTSC